MLNSLTGRVVNGSPYTLITTPIYYTNNIPHIGHAYTNIIASCTNIWHKLLEEKTFLLTGTDEHGQKIEVAARELGEDINQFIQKYSDNFRDLANKLEIDHDDFIRTTETRHKKVVTELWNILVANDHIYLGEYSGFYSIRDEAFYQESELIDGKAPTGAEVKWTVEESYFFKLSAFQDQLLAFYEQNQNFIIPHARRNEVINFVKAGLHDLCISRTSFSHGIPVPGNEKHVIYVWIDALANYISALDFPNGENYKNFWKNLESNKIHIIGKDILRFHAIYWPAILMAANLPLPSNLIVHGWWMKDGQKISKSIGNVIDPLALIDEFGVDYVKYFFLAETGIASDGDYNREKFIQKINADLVNNFGNLLSRVTNLTMNSLSGKAEFNQNNEFILNQNNFIEEYIKLMNDFKYNLAANEIFKFSSEVNQLIDQIAPWKLNDQKKINDILYISLEALRILTIALQPFIPNKCQEIFKKLHLDNDFYPLSALQERHTNYNNIEKLNIFKRLL